METYAVRFGDFSICSTELLWSKIENYNKAPSASTVIEILWIKLKYDVKANPLHSSWFYFFFLFRSSIKILKTGFAVISLSLKWIRFFFSFLILHVFFILVWCPTKSHFGRHAKGCENSVLDRTSILLIKSQLQCRRFAHFVIFNFLIIKVWKWTQEIHPKRYWNKIRICEISCDSLFLIQYVIMWFLLWFGYVTTYCEWFLQTVVCFLKQM